MSGLDKIIGQISAEATHSAEAVLEEARTKAAALCAEADAGAEAECKRIAARAERGEKDALARAESAAALQKRRAVLAAKQQLIAEVLAKAQNTLAALPADEYFAAMQKLAAKFALPGEGTVYFGAEDLARLPAGLEASLNQAAAPKGAKLTISKETRPIHGGFVLAYGGIEENCSFAALFSADKEHLQDEVQQLLFS